MAEVKIQTTLTGATGSRPSSPETGEMYFDSTVGIPVWYNGANWITAAGVAST